MKRISLILTIFVAALAGYYVRANKPVNTSSVVDSVADTANTIKTTGKALSYAGKSLGSFPKEVLKNTSITSLDLSNNNLTGSLPSEIHNLASLESLNVSNNRMTGIPAEVGQLKHLRVLNYANNQITGLPNELGNLTQLEILDLSGNNVSQQDLSGIRAKLTNTQIKL